MEKAIMDTTSLIKDIIADDMTLTWVAVVIRVILIIAILILFLPRQTKDLFKPGIPEVQFVKRIMLIATLTNLVLLAGTTLLQVCRNVPCGIDSHVGIIAVFNSLCFAVLVFQGILLYSDHNKEKIKGKKRR